MREDIQHPPIMNILSAVKGFVSGGFMALAIFAAWDPFSRLVLFVAGFIIFVDAIMPVNSALYAATAAFFLIISGLLGFFAAVAGSGLLYLLVLIIVAVVVYLDKIRMMRRLGKTE